MARQAITDPLQNFGFWLLDIAPIETLGLPLFTPQLGFQSITAPELTLDVEEIEEGNWPYKRKIVTGGNTNTITLQRAVTLGDTDFYKWALAGVFGDRSILTGGPLGTLSVGGMTYRRTFMLLQTLPRTTTNPRPRGFSSDGRFLRTNNTAGIGALLQTLAVAGAAIGAGNALSAAGAYAAAFAGGGPFDTFARIPGRAFLLQNCIPTRFKAAGDFDASSSDVSIQELDLAYESFDLIDLAV